MLVVQLEDARELIQHDYVDTAHCVINTKHARSVDPVLLENMFFYLFVRHLLNI